MTKSISIKQYWDGLIYCPLAATVLLFFENPIDYWFLAILVVVLEVSIFVFPELNLDAETQKNIYIGPFNLLYFLSSLPLIALIFGLTLKIFFKSEHFTQVFSSSLYVICCLLIGYLTPFKTFSSFGGDVFKSFFYFIFSLSFLLVKRTDISLTIFGLIRTALLKVSPVLIILLWIAAILNIILASSRVIPDKNLLQKYRKLRVIVFALLGIWNVFLYKGILEEASPLININY